MEEKIIILINNVLEGHCSEDEIRELKTWIEEDDSHRQQFLKYKKMWNATRHPHISKLSVESARNQFVDFIHQSRRQYKTFVVKRVAIWSAAASIILLAGIFLGSDLYDKYFYEGKTLAEARVEGGKPGLKAELELSTGEKLNLTPDKSATFDTSVLESADIIRKAVNSKGNTLDFSKIQEAVDIKSTIKIPVSGYYKLTLNDGSTVILNSASELIFPVKFASNERRVYLKGEAYFDVVHDSRRKFIVSTERGMDITVHGTAFNVNAYKSDMVVTTLVRGSISCRSALTGKTVMVKPNQTLKYNPSQGSSTITTSDTYLYTAWKDGKFVFDNQTIEEILCRLSRWYNLKVEYMNEGIKNETFTGVISRQADPNDILKLIQSTTAVHFSVRGNTVIVR